MYLTIEDHYKQNADRHLERAIAYASAGYHDRYYEASMKKALKWYKKADALKLPKYLDETIKMLGKKIADHIMNGNVK